MACTDARHCGQRRSGSCASALTKQLAQKRWPQGVMTGRAQVSKHTGQCGCPSELCWATRPTMPGEIPGKTLANNSTCALRPRLC